MEDDKPKKQYNEVPSRLLMPTANQKNSQWKPKEKVEENKWKVSLSAAGAIKDQPDTYSVPKSLENVQSRLYAPTMASKSGSINNKPVDEVKSKTLAFGSTYKSSSAASSHRPSNNDNPEPSPRTGLTKNSLVGSGNSEPNFLRPTKAFIESQYHKAPSSNDPMEERNKSIETLNKKNNSNGHSTTAKTIATIETEKKTVDVTHNKTSSVITHKKPNDKTTKSAAAPPSPAKKALTSNSVSTLSLAHDAVKSTTAPVITKASLKNTLNLSAPKVSKQTNFYI